jgi:DNA helicase-2/ATP-dependent DNA helicase PcrA
MEEERRLFYVAMTRARDELYITHATRRFLYGKEEQHRCSQFIAEFSFDLVSPIQPVKPNPPKSRLNDDQLSLF